METSISGLHHVTAIASHPQENVDFYAGLLGLRLVKRTVNFDDPTAYHLYYGDELGSPGSIVTFFYWPGQAGRGQVGAGQPSALAFSAPSGSIEFWEDRIQAGGGTTQRTHIFHQEALEFDDPDGIPLVIIPEAVDSRVGWQGSDVPSNYALRGVHSVELTVRSSQLTETLLTECLGFRLEEQMGQRARYAVGPGGAGRFLDIEEDPQAHLGVSGAGPIHHLACSVRRDEDQLNMLKRLQRSGLAASSVKDRNYFRSIYFREPAGILLEIATETPGFMIDEVPENLGGTLQLPKEFEHSREEIESVLPPIVAPVYHQRKRKT